MNHYKWWLIHNQLLVLFNAHLCLLSRKNVNIIISICPKHFLRATTFESVCGSFTIYRATRTRIIWSRKVLSTKNSILLKAHIFPGPILWNMKFEWITVCIVTYLACSFSWRYLIQDLYRNQKQPPNGLQQKKGWFDCQNMSVK